MLSVLIVLLLYVCYPAESRQAVPAQDLPRAAGATPRIALSSADSDEASSTEEIDGYSRLVSTPSRVSGAVTKQAVLSQRKFDSSLFRDEAFKRWLTNTSLAGGLSPLSTPPISQACTVVVNHRLRYVYIRTRKTASSTVVRALEAAGACPGTRPALCLVACMRTREHGTGVAHACAQLCLLGSPPAMTCAV